MLITEQDLISALEDLEAIDCVTGLEIPNKDKTDRIQALAMIASDLPTNCRNCGAVLNTFHRCDYCKAQY